MLALPMLAFCVALMTAMHYYAIFFLVPLFLAEMMRWRMSRKLDAGVLAALASSVLVLGLHYPLIAAGTIFQKHFWSPAEWRHIPEVYYAYFDAILVKCILPLGVLAVLSTTPEDWTAKRPSLTPPEWVVAGALSLMPLCVVALSKYTTHVFTPRYVLWAVPGFAVLVVALVCQAARGRAAVGVSLLSAVVVLSAWAEVRILKVKPALKYGERVRQALASLPDGPEPIVVADIHAFMELSYYVQGRIRDRLVYPISRDLDLRYLGSDTDALLSSALRRRTNLRMLEYDAAIATQPRFVLAALPGDYLPQHLVHTGYRVTAIGSSAVPVLYEAEALAPGK